MSYNDLNGHGTHAAGTVCAAKDNNSGVVGVAPGAGLWAVRVLNSQGWGTWSSIMCGIDWVTARAGTIEVANMSLGGDGAEGSCTDGGLHQAICASVATGVTYVVAAGNSAADARYFVPASYDEVITVSAIADFDGKPGGTGAPTCQTGFDDTFASFSNYGQDVDLTAPGVCVLSTYRGNTTATMSGTSMASPHVAGARPSTSPGTPARPPPRSGRPSSTPAPTTGPEIPTGRRSRWSTWRRSDRASPRVGYGGPGARIGARAGDGRPGGRPTATWLCSAST